MSTLTSPKVVNSLRNHLRNLAARRTSRMVTADDAQAFLSKKGVSELKIRTRLAYVNSVLRSPDFKAASTTESTRPVAKGRSITTWKVTR